MVSAVRLKGAFMKLHYMGKYNLDPDSLPHGDHMPGAVQFKEAGSSGELGVLATLIHTIKFMDNFYILTTGWSVSS